MELESGHGGGKRKWTMQWTWQRKHGNGKLLNRNGNVMEMDSGHEVAMEPGSEKPSEWKWKRGSAMEMESGNGTHVL